jgi:hypothetical protein
MARLPQKSSMPVDLAEGKQRMASLFFAVLSLFFLQNSEAGAEIPKLRRDRNRRCPFSIIRRFYQSFFS